MHHFDASPVWILDRRSPGLACIGENRPDVELDNNSFDFHGNRAILVQDRKKHAFNGCSSAHYFSCVVIAAETRVTFGTYFVLLIVTKWRPIFDFYRSWTGEYHLRIRRVLPLVLEVYHWCTLDIRKVKYKNPGGHRLKRVWLWTSCYLTEYFKKRTSSSCRVTFFFILYNLLWRQELGPSTISQLWWAGETWSILYFTNINALGNFVSLYTKCFVNRCCIQSMNLTYYIIVFIRIPNMLQKNWLVCVRTVTLLNFIF